MCIDRRKRATGWFPISLRANPSATVQTFRAGTRDTRASASSWLQEADRLLGEKTRDEGVG